MTLRTCCSAVQWCLLCCNRGVSSFRNLGGQAVMRRAAAARRRLLICQILGGQLPTLPTPHLRPETHAGSESLSCYAYA